MGAGVRGLRGRSGLDKVDLHTRWTLSAMVWVGVAVQSALSLSRPVRASAAPWLIVAVCLLAVFQGAHATRMTSTALDAYLGRTAVRHGQLRLGGALLAVNLVATEWLAQNAGPGGFPRLWMALGGAVMPFATWFCLSVRLRTAVLAHVALLAAGCGVCAFAGSRVRVLDLLVSVGLWGGWTVVGSRCSARTLDVMWKLRETRDVQALLAVAEERLRFGRDMHDVLGRNLAVIALKSELAVELAQRGRAEAVDQMVEVQRIARASQQEIREVVRGYREADLRTELAGAQSVLRAAGIECGIEGGAGAGLPAPVQSALGWVVREAATNVLRHGDPRRCTIWLGTTADAVVLDMENDGAEEAAVKAGAGGSGLAGLRERLGTLDGSLDAGPAGDGLFRLTATIPVPRPRTAPLREER
ncbi:sensor histidine kinase [Streptomyces sp. LN785]|uniref:sensor histidine kinase n=1 Tax=Streptomyces sp. LN785 TaxID=3112983 RepID=UPI00372123D9